MAVGLVYDPIYLEHDTGQHPERAARLMETVAALKREGLWEKLHHLSPRPATPEELALVHSPEHIRWVEETAQRGGGWLDMDTVMSPRSYEAARYAAGGALRAVEAVLGGEVGKAFALVRPPGHHATPTRAMGFCLFNNIAIAARLALEHKGIERLLIFDYDAHHGNGTQEAFYADPRVLYFSVHQSPLYPGTGLVTELGEGEAKGTNVNVPVPPGSGDEEYQEVCRLLAEVARRFRPQLLLVSAGYDGHWLDGISQLQLSAAGYTLVARAADCLADELCQGRIAFVLEGGYHLAALPASVAATLKVLMGEEPSDPLGPPVESAYRHPHEIAPVLRTVRRLLGLAESA